MRVVPACVLLAMTPLGLVSCAEPSRRDSQAAAECARSLERATSVEAVQQLVPVEPAPSWAEDQLQWTRAYAWATCLARSGFTCSGAIGPAPPVPETRPGPDIFLEPARRPRAECSRDGGSFSNPFGEGLTLRD